MPGLLIVQVCNHPDLFEGRPIVSSYDVPAIDWQVPSIATKAVAPPFIQAQQLGSLGLLPRGYESMSSWEAADVAALAMPMSDMQTITNEALQNPLSALQDANMLARSAAHAHFGIFGLADVVPIEHDGALSGPGGHQSGPHGPHGSAAVAAGPTSQGLRAAFQHAVGISPALGALAHVLSRQADNRAAWRSGRAALLGSISTDRCLASPMYGENLIRALTFAHPVAGCLRSRGKLTELRDTPSLILELSPSYEQRAEACHSLLQEFMFVIPKARAAAPNTWCIHPDLSVVRKAARDAVIVREEFFQRAIALRTALVRQQLFFPDRRLLQFDCGKLQELAELLRKLKAGGHRVLIFTQVMYRVGWLCMLLWFICKAMYAFVVMMTVVHVAKWMPACLSGLCRGSSPAVWYCCLLVALIFGGIYPLIDV